MMLAIAAELDYEVFMLDVQRVFLDADVEEGVSAKMASGDEIADTCDVPLVMKLKKRLYCLRQSPTNLVCTMDHHLAKIGFRPLKSDQCLYVSEDDSGVVILMLYVDDILLLGANKQLLNKPRKQLMDRVEMTDMGDVSRVLGMNVARDRKKRNDHHRSESLHGGHHQARWHERLFSHLHTRRSGTGTFAQPTGRESSGRGKANGGTSKS